MPFFPFHAVWFLSSVERLGKIIWRWKNRIESNRIEFCVCDKWHLFKEQITIKWKRWNEKNWKRKIVFMYGWIVPCQYKQLELYFRNWNSLFCFLFFFLKMTFEFSVTFVFWWALRTHVQCWWPFRRWTKGNILEKDKLNSILNLCKQF